jgi:hypothetical protein
MCRTYRFPGSSFGSCAGIAAIRSRRRRCSVGSVIAFGLRPAALHVTGRSRCCGWAHRIVLVGMIASSITSARIWRRLSVPATSGWSPSLWPRSSSGSGQAGTARTNQGSRHWSSSGRNAASALTTSTFSMRSSGRRSSRSAPTAHGSPGSGSTDTSGPNAKPQGPASSSARCQTGSRHVISPDGYKRSL